MGNIRRLVDYIGVDDVMLNGGLDGHDVGNRDRPTDDMNNIKTSSGV